MLPITSRTSTERVVRSLLLALMVAAFAVYFLYDGYVGYPRSNVAQLATLLGLPGAGTAVPNPALTADRGRKIAEATRAGEPLEKIKEAFGSPAFRQGGFVYFLGPGGWLKAEVDGERVRSMKWVDGPHTESDMAIQRFVGWLLVLTGLAAMLHLVRVLFSRAELTEEGLRIPGRRVVPFEAMAGLRWSKSQTGVSELDYTMGGRTETIRLDPYLYKEAGEIARAIAERKGFGLSTDKS